MTTTELTAPISEEPGTCRNCGSKLEGTYCSNCGERAFVPGEHSVRHFLGDVLNAITFLDTKFLRTLKLMIVRPGAMSYQYINGRRVPFIKPMSMFFIVNLVYFMFAMGDALNSTLYSQLNNMPHSSIAKEMVVKKIKAEKISEKAFTASYESQSTDMAKMWLVLLVLFFSIPLGIVNIGRKVFFFDHLIVSLEFISIGTIYMFIILPWLTALAHKLGAFPGQDLDSTIKYPLIVIAVVLLFFFERNTYKQNLFRSLTKAALLLFFFYLTLQLYRASLFFITMWTL